MNPKRKHRQFGKMAAIMFAGVVTGFVLRYAGKEAQAEAGVSSEAVKAQHDPEEEEKTVRSPGSTKLKDRKVAEGNIAFSPWQWSQMLRDPRAMRLSISECAPGAAPALHDLPLVDHLFEAAGSGPELIDHMMLFGWDRARQKEIRGMLSQLAGEVKRVQGESARIIYPGGGSVRVDYSPGESRLRDLTTGFGKRLVELIGPREAERFMVLSGVPSWQSENIELTVSKSPDGKSLVLKGVQAFGSVEIEGGSEASERLRAFQLLNEGAAPSGIDWERLVEEAGTGASLDR